MKLNKDETLQFATESDTMPWMGTVVVIDNIPSEIGGSTAKPTQQVEISQDWNPDFKSASGIGGNVEAIIVPNSSTFMGVPSFPDKTSFVDQKVYYKYGLVDDHMAFKDDGNGNYTEYLELPLQDSQNAQGVPQGLVAGEITASKDQFLNGLSLNEAVQYHAQDFANSLWNTLSNDGADKQYLDFSKVLTDNNWQGGTSQLVSLINQSNAAIQQLDQNLANSWAATQVS